MREPCEKAIRCRINTGMLKSPKDGRCQEGKETLKQELLSLITKEKLKGNSNSNIVIPKFFLPSLVLNSSSDHTDFLMLYVTRPSLGQRDLKTRQRGGTSLELVVWGDSVKPSQKRQLCAMPLKWARDSELEEALAGGEGSTLTLKDRNYDGARCSQGATLTWLLGERSAAVGSGKSEQVMVSHRR